MSASFFPTLSLAITGLVLPLLNLNAADQPSWPSWRGDGSGADQAQIDLVDDLNKARLLWQSEAKIISNDQGCFGGWSSPVIADGRLYLMYAAPGTTLFDPTEKDKWKDGYVEGITNAVLNDEVAIAMDVNTGKTIWTRRWPDVAPNYNKSWKRGGHFVPSFGAGMLFVIGPGGHATGLDAATGKERWRIPLPGIGKQIMEQRDLYQSSGTCPAKKADGGNMSNNSPAYADGVVAFGNNRNLYGYAATTGKRLWVVEACMNSRSSPVVWSHSGKNYFIAGDRCIEARSGKVLWTIPGAKIGGTPAVHGKLLVINGAHVPNHPKADKRGRLGYVCYKISPTSAEILHATDGDEIRGREASPLIYGEVAFLCPDRSCAVNRGHGELHRNGYVAWNLKTGETQVLRGTVMDESASAFGGSGRFFGIGGGGINMFTATGNNDRVLSKGWRPKSWWVSTTPTLLGGFLFIRGQDGIYCYDLRK